MSFNTCPPSRDSFLPIRVPNLCMLLLGHHRILNPGQPELAQSIRRQVPTYYTPKYPPPHLNHPPQSPSLSSASGRRHPLAAAATLLFWSSCFNCCFPVATSASSAALASLMFLSASSRPAVFAFSNTALASSRSAAASLDARSAIAR